MKEAIQERIGLYSKLLMALIAALFLVGSGVASLLAMGNNPELGETGVSLLEAGMALFFILFVPIYELYRHIIKLINQLLPEAQDGSK